MIRLSIGNLGDLDSAPNSGALRRFASDAIMDRLTAARLLEVAEKRAKEAIERTTRQRELVARLEGQLGRVRDEAHAKHLRRKLLCKMSPLKVQRERPQMQPSATTFCLVFPPRFHHSHEMPSRASSASPGRR